jgi:hypothetical protein
VTYPLFQASTRPGLQTSQSKTMLLQSREREPPDSSARRLLRCETTHARPVARPTPLCTRLLRRRTGGMLHCQSSSHTVSLHTSFRLFLFQSRLHAPNREVSADHWISAMSGSSFFTARLVARRYISKLSSHEAATRQAFSLLPSLDEPDCTFVEAGLPLYVP